jgi:hypothetical protein
MARRPSELGSLRGAALQAARRRFREIFPGGFRDTTYRAWERDYKVAAHRRWREVLGQAEWRRLLEVRAYDDVARRIATFYARSHLNMLALYEWMALREALVDPTGARLLATGLYDLVHGRGGHGPRLEAFTALLDRVPQRQSRLAKWPVVTLIPFVARPDRHLIVKPRIIARVAERFGVDLRYRPRPNAETYGAVMSFASWLRDTLGARDLIDVQSFLWVIASDEYADWPWE